MLDALSPRGAAALGLLALPPVLVFTVSRSGVGGLISAVNVVLIFGALYIALSPIDGAGHSADGEKPS